MEIHKVQDEISVVGSMCDEAIKKYDSLCKMQKMAQKTTSESLLFDKLVDYSINIDKDAEDLAMDFVDGKVDVKDFEKRYISTHFHQIST